MRHLFSALLVSTMVAMPVTKGALADDGGVLNPEDRSIQNLSADLARHPDRSGIICWVAYETHKGGIHDVALESLMECAAAGNAPSMILLSHIYENGYGTDPSPEQATYWVRRAAEEGYAVGQYHYGMALLRGHGVEKNEAEAIAWLKRAADNGDETARDVLQNM